MLLPICHIFYFSFQSHMKGIVNRLDTYGNSAAHYAKPYPDQSVAKLLLKHGAKIEINDQVGVGIF